MVPDIDFMAYIDSKGIKYKEQGNELKFHHCPFCETNGKPSKPYNTFSFNREKQTYFCHHRNSCGMQGGLYNFKIEMGDINPITKTTRIVYERPLPKPKITSDIDKFYDWYEKKRGISKEILKQYKVGMERVDKKSVTMIYQYFDKDNKLINRKYKNSLDKKKLWTEKNAEQIYYGLQYVNYNDSLLYVTEGEDDCHAFAQITGLNQVVSIPYGANNYTIHMDKVNKCFETIVLLFDCDEKGQEGAKNFAKKAGLHKCHNIILPYKDVRECLLHGINKDRFNKYIGKAKQFSHDEIVKPEAFRDEFNRSLRSNSNLGYMTPHKEFNRITKGVRVSELTILTGGTGSGKTTFAYNVGLWCESANMPFLAMSFENRMSSIIKKLICVDTGEMVQAFDSDSNKMVQVMSDSDIDIAFDRINRKDIYFLNKTGVKEGYYDLEKMIDVIEYAVKFYNVKNIIIDHLHYFLKLSGERNPVQVIDESIRIIKQLTERLNVHVLLIVHPHKVGEGANVGLNSPKGASSISQECDNFWVVKRGENGDDDEFDFDLKSEFTMLKNREYGMVNKNNLVFDVKENCNTFYVARSK